MKATYILEWLDKGTLTLLHKLWNGVHIFYRGPLQPRQGHGRPWLQENVQRRPPLCLEVIPGSRSGQGDAETLL